MRSFRILMGSLSTTLLAGCSNDARESVASVIGGAAGASVVVVVATGGRVSTGGTGQAMTGGVATGGRATGSTGGATTVAASGTAIGGVSSGGMSTGGRSSTGGTVSCMSGQLKWGVNVHDGGGDPQKLADILNARHLTTARMDLYANDSAYLAKFKNAVARLAFRGIAVEAIVFDAYSPGNAQSQNCSADLAVVETNAYDETLSQIRATEDIISDFELMNEVSLSANIKVSGSTGQAASDYDVACGRMQAANLRGMSRAIVDERKRTGRPLRIILGTTDRSFGFLSFMDQQGVSFDVAGYHIYPWEKHAALDLDPWFGSGGPLGQLARFNRPIHLNEFNCGEIYSGSQAYPNDPNYENKAGQPVTETCLRSVAKHLVEITNQSVANVESVHMYEIWDEPNKSAPENRFGLMIDLDTPKVNLFLVSAFSGGALTATESSELTSRGLLSTSQISSWSTCGAGATNR